MIGLKKNNKLLRKEVCTLFAREDLTTKKDKEKFPCLFWFDSFVFKLIILI